MWETRTFRAFQASALARLSRGQARSARGAALAVSASICLPAQQPASALGLAPDKERADWRKKLTLIEQGKAVAASAAGHTVC